MPIAISDDATATAIASLRRYFTERLDLDLSELQARLLLDFVLREIGPSVYNAAISDAQVYFRDRVSDLEGACFEAEFNYWPRETRRSTR